MKRWLFKIIKVFIISIVSILLVSVGIDAADHFDNFSASIIGRVFTGKPKGPCPPEMSFVVSKTGDYCIDIFENSPGDQCVFKNPANQTETKANIDNYDCKSVSRIGSLPWTNISQTQATMECAKSGKRLPTDSEWYQAALNTPDPSDGWGQDDCQVSKNWESQPGPTGSGKKCISSSGAYDMVGNVWEWVNGSVYDGVLEGKKLPSDGYVKTVDSNGLVMETDQDTSDSNFNHDYFWIKNSGLRGVAKGGYWDNQGGAGVFSFYLVSPPTFAGNGVGFRCMKMAEKN
jgi:formylglycine-generating enzyme required for sulfatase activity